MSPPRNMYPAPPVGAFEAQFPVQLFMPGACCQGVVSEVALLESLPLAAI